MTDAKELLEVAKRAAAAGAALTLLAGVCAWTTDANEIIPATADNQKALLRRITTLSREIEDRHRRLSVPGIKTRASNGAPSSARHLPLREPSRQVGFSHFFARLREPGGYCPRQATQAQFRHTVPLALRGAYSHHPAGPPFSAGAPAGRRTAESLRKCCVLRETQAERYGWKTGSGPQIERRHGTY